VLNIETVYNISLQYRFFIWFSYRFDMFLDI